LNLFEITLKFNNIEIEVWNRIEFVWNNIEI
jgi:hypothetical protein